MQHLDRGNLCAFYLHTVCFAQKISLHLRNSDTISPSPETILPSRR
jgi:hypothetical protein